MKVISVGPFLGDFRTEILYFRPFVQWLYSNLEFESFFVSSHFNRSFLYGENTTFMPIYECLTRNELNQDKGIHTEIDQKEFLSIKRELKHTISKYCSKNKCDILEYSLPYSNSQTCLIPPYQKKYLPINFSYYNIEIEDYIVYIPDINEKKSICLAVYKELKKNFKNVIVIGDLHIHLPEENEILKKKDYFRNGYKWLLSYLHNAKFVVCPGSFWTFLCNLQGINVISWSKNPGIYKDGGEFHLENENCLSFFAKDNKDTLFKMLNYQIEKML